MLNFLLRTVGVMLLGPVVVALGRRWPSAWTAAAMLAGQLVLIIVSGLAPLSALLAAVVLLGGFAWSTLRWGSSSAPKLHAGGGLFLAGFLSYWIMEKYVLPLGLDLWLVAKTSGFVRPLADLQVFAMVGISYIGFKVIHFVLDWRAGAIREARVVEFLAWLFFFPSIVAGPIQRFQDWQAQRASSILRVEDASEGLQRLIQGMFMKLVLADNLRESTLVGMSAGGLSSASFWRLCLAAVGYSFYLYWDFAGYSSMAIGLGRFWGIRLPENFNQPFGARNLNEFWRRWHMTLTEFLRDYAFYPLSLAMKRGLGRTHPNLCAAMPPMCAFLAMGAWHGATVGYLIFGLLHGLGVASLAIGARYRSKVCLPLWWKETRTGHCLAVLTNFAYVTFAFIFFSLPDEGLVVLLQRLVN